MRRSESIRKSPHQYNLGFGSAREWKNDSVTSIVYMIQYGYININVYMYDIISLLAEWDSKDCMDMASTFHMR